MKTESSKRRREARGSYECFLKERAECGLGEPNHMWAGPVTDPKLIQIQPTTTASLWFLRLSPSFISSQLPKNSEFPFFSLISLWRLSCGGSPDLQWRQHRPPPSPSPALPLLLCFRPRPPPLPEASPRRCRASVCPLAPASPPGSPRSGPASNRMPSSSLPLVCRVCCLFIDLCLLWLLFWR